MLKNTTIKVLGPGPTAKFVGTIAQDSIQNKKDEQNTHCEWIHILSETVFKKKRSTYCQKKKKKKEKSEVVFEKEK